jgi:hypothetical protein
MNKKGVGYNHEILLAVFFLVLVLAFYGTELKPLGPMLLMVIGGVMVLGGMVIREPDVTAGGIAMLAVAIVYQEIVL